MKSFLIVPCYNEAKTLGASFPIFNKLLEETSANLHGIFFVNDGSSDNTANILIEQRKQLKPANKVQNTILNLESNQGKAGAILEAMTKLYQEKGIRDTDLVFLLDGDIIEKIPAHIVEDITEMFHADKNLNMVIIGANEGYATDEVMIEASGQRVLKFGPAYKALSQALHYNKNLGYGIEGLLNKVFEDSTRIYEDVVIVTKQPYRSNNQTNSALRQAQDLKHAKEIADKIFISSN